ncbi:hypothetical protein D3C81_1669210 [compost metagenome]
MHERHRHDLPRHAELVFQPAALLGFDGATLGQIAPEMVDLFLILAIDLERDRLAEFEHRPTVKAGEGLAIEFETDGHHRTFRFAMKFLTELAVVGQAGDFRVIED